MSDSEQPTIDDEALIRAARKLMIEGARSGDKRILQLASQAVDFLKEGHGMEAMLMMLPDEDDQQQPFPMMPQYQPRKRR